MGFSARINQRRFRRAMARAPERLAQEMARGMEQHALAFDAHLKRTRFGGQGGALQSRRGVLARSSGHAGPQSRKRVSSLRMLIFIGQGVAKRYARIQEKGGVVVPRSAQYLTVPLPDNLTAAGVPRFKSARALMGTGRTFITKTRAGNLLIGMHAAKGRVKWLWVLKRKVRLRRRLGFIDTFNSREMRRDRVQRVNAAVKRALRPAAGGAT